MSDDILDWGLLGLCLGGTVALALWLGRGARNLNDFALAGRDRPWWLILLSIVATETSTLTFLSIPGFAYARDLSWLQLATGFLIGRVVVARVWLPRYFRHRILTAYELLRRRFGQATQRTASALFILTRTLADGLRLFLTAIVLEELASVPLPWAVVVIGVATTAYTLVGGMRAVLWADLIQFVIYTVGGVLALSQLIAVTPGGWSGILEVASAHGKLHAIVLSWDLSDAYTLPAGVLGGIVVTLGSHGVDQMLVQRYLCARSVRDASKALVFSGVIVWLQFALFLAIGLGLFAFYAQAQVAFDRPDRVFARFIVEEMPVGLRGVLLGAVFSAAMSTLSSSLNSCATAAVSDFHAPLLAPQAGPERLLRATRGWTLLFALLQMSVGIGGQWLDQSIVASVLAIASFSLGITLGVFLLGLRDDATDQAAALFGVVVGLGAMTAIVFATALAWPWYALVGSSLTFAGGRIAAWWRR